MVQRRYHIPEFFYSVPILNRIEDAADKGSPDPGRAVGKRRHAARLPDRSPVDPTVSARSGNRTTPGPETEPGAVKKLVHPGAKTEPGAGKKLVRPGTETEPNNKEYNKDNIKEYNKECAAPPPKEPFRKYGEYANVKLTDRELEALKRDYPDDWRQRVDRLSEYMASTGKKYQNHLATIRSWARQDDPKPVKKGLYADLKGGIEL